MRTSLKVTHSAITLALLLALSAAALANTFTPTVANIGVSDQKAGSILVFPYYTSDLATGSDTLITVTNVCNGPQATAGVPNYSFLHLFFLSGANCSPADTFLCLTPNGSLQILASDYDPMVTGYLIAVAVDGQTGAPVQNNCFIGSAFVRDNANSTIGSYGAEAFWKLSATPAPVSGGNATLSLDGTNYDAAPVQFSAQIQDPGTGAGSADEIIVLASVSGNLGESMSSAVQVGFGVLYRSDEFPASFTPSIGSGCFSQTVVQPPSGSNPGIRIVPGNINTFLKGDFGYLKFNTTPAVGLLISKQGAANSNVNQFSGIRTLHKTNVGEATLITPCFPPFCGF
jgi:hypothetical protein